LTGQGSEPSCELENHSIANPPKYHALSYVWRSEMTTRTVFLNKISFAVTPTVLAAINQLYCRVGIVLVWVDQICINQEDDDEKAEQVARMGEIYSKAEIVLIWMGTTADGSDVLLNKMPLLLKAAQEARTHYEAATDFDLYKLTTPPTTEELWGSLGLFYQRAWFHRLWVLQEAILAKRLYLICGSREVDWDLLCNISRTISIAGIFHFFKYSEVDKDRALTGAKNMSELKSVRSIGSPLDGMPFSGFLELLEHVKVRQVIHTVDRIWAVLAMASRGLQNMTKHYMNYTSLGKKEYWRTWITFSKLLLLHDPRLAMLSWADRQHILLTNYQHGVLISVQRVPVSVLCFNTGETSKLVFQRERQSKIILVRRRNL
jgi:hypothetical protein